MADRTCACNCGQSIEGRRKNTYYVDSRHRDRAYRKRLRRELDAAGLPGSLSLEAARAATGTGKRRTDARASRRSARRCPRPGDTVYLPPGQLEIVKAAIEAAAQSGQDVAEIERVLDAAAARRAKRTIA